MKAELKIEICMFIFSTCICLNQLDQTEKKCRELQARHKVDEDQLKVNLQQSQAQAAALRHLRQEVTSKEDQLKCKEQEIQALSLDAQNISKEVCDLAICPHSLRPFITKKIGFIWTFVASISKCMIARAANLSIKLVNLYTWVS